ncbi:MAG: hypothetical protein LBQ51_10270 [Desulfovibrio sp.]|jgi:hypothetical protein|nr:hypothetical protein [Desulfovibrio sp.]
MSAQFYEKFFETQKSMFEEWQKTMQASYKNVAAASETAENQQEFYKKVFGSSDDFFKKIGDSSQVYQSLFDLWKRLSESGPSLDAKAAGEIYEDWSRHFFEQLREVFVPTVPAFMQHFTENFVDKFESTDKVLAGNFKTWFTAEEELRKAWFDSLGKGPKGYVDFLEVWRKTYEDTTGKLVNAPTFGKDMDSWKLRKAVFDSYIKYSIAATRFSVALADIAGEATRKTLDDYTAMFAGEQKIKTFDEFYKYWSKTVSSTYEKVLFSDEMSRLAGNMVDEMANFRSEFDKLFELSFADLPIPKKSDMDDLYATMYALKKEVRALKKEVKTLAGAKS